VNRDNDNDIFHCQISLGSYALCAHVCDLVFSLGVGSLNIVKRGGARAYITSLRAVRMKNDDFQISRNLLLTVRNNKVCHPDQASRHDHIQKRNVH
jgi:hypothetical protein